MNRYIGELATDVYGIAADEARVAHLSWTAEEAAAADDDGLFAEQTVNDKDVEVTTFLNPMPCARTIIITPTGTAGNVKAVSAVVEGTDIGGNPISETLPEFTEDENTAVTSTKAFKTVTKITIPAQDGEVTFKAGWTDALGLPFAFAKKPLVFALLGGTLETTAPALTIDSDEPQKNTIDLNSALDGDNAVDAYFVL